MKRYMAGAIVLAMGMLVSCGGGEFVLVDESAEKVVSPHHRRE